MARKKKTEDLAEKSTRAVRKKNKSLSLPLEKGERSIFLNPPTELERVICDLSIELPIEEQIEIPPAFGVLPIPPFVKGVVGISEKGEKSLPLRVLPLGKGEKSLSLPIPPFLKGVGGILAKGEETPHSTLQDGVGQVLRHRSISITHLPHDPSQHIVNLKNVRREFISRSGSEQGIRPSTSFGAGQTRRARGASRVFNFGIQQHSKRLGVMQESRFARVWSEVAAVTIVRSLFGLARVCFRILDPLRVLVRHFRIPAFHYPLIALKRYSIAGFAALGFALDRVVTLLYRIEDTTTRAKSKEKSKRVSEKRKNNSNQYAHGMFLLPHGWHRALASFVAISFVFVLPLKAMSSYTDIKSAKDEVVAKSKLGISQALSGISLAKQSPLHAVSEFEKAGVSFGEASKELASINSFILKLARLNPRTAKEIETGKRMVETAEKLSHTAAVLGGAGDVFGSDTDLINKVSEFRVRLASVMPAIVAAAGNLNSIDFEFLGISEKDIRAMQETLLSITHSLEEFVDFGDNFLALLGAEHSKKYLFLFQNNTELRPTGGFIGSIAEATIDRGEIKKLWIPGGGPYDLDGGLRVGVAPPYPLQLISDMWKFRDANWFPDFPTSANKIAWFYERSGGGTVDGIVAVNASVVEDLLEILGPIEMPEYEKTITADNFMIETQKAVELEYDKELNQPKKFIADLTPRFLEKLGSAFGTNYLEILDVFMRNMRTRDIQLAFRDDRIQEKMYEYDWAGHIKDVPEGTDYLAVIHANIAGMKSDARMKQRIVHRSEVQNDGTVEDTVVIHRTHTGEKGELFSGVQNVDYARVYVPEGSVLLEASGFTETPKNFFDDTSGVPFDQDLQNISGSFAVHGESGTIINNEFNKTVFGNWILTEPGAESVVTLRYRLPWKLGVHETGAALYQKGNPLLKYGLLVQKQSGIQSELTSELYLHTTKEVLGRYPDSWKGAENNFEVRDVLDGDKFYSLLLR